MIAASLAVSSAYRSICKALSFVFGLEFNEATIASKNAKLFDILTTESTGCVCAVYASHGQRFTDVLDTLNVLVLALYQSMITACCVVFHGLITTTVFIQLGNVKDGVAFTYIVDHVQLYDWLNFVS